MSNNHRTSIRTQLMQWLLFPLLALIILSIYPNYQMASSFANSAFDDGLEEVTRAVAGQVEFDDGHWHLASPKLSEQIIAYKKYEQMKFLILGPSGEIIAGNPELGLPLTDSIYPNFRNIWIDDQLFRVSTIQIPVQHGVLTIEVGETILERNELTRKILINTIAHQLVLLLLAIVCVWWGVRQGLQSLEKMRIEVAKRIPNDFSSLDESKSPDEIRPLIQTLNNLIEQQCHYSGSQQRFVANAAHQLRTPLAGLRIQLELALRQNNPERTQHALRQMEIGLERGISLTEGLLTLAKMEPAALMHEKFEALDLINLIEYNLQLLIPQASAKKIKLHMEKSEGHIAMINGNASSLNELIVNVLDNAIRYTSSGGEVRVHVQSEANSVILSVIDTGPGIPHAECEKVFERFYRIPGTVDDGNGLGLAIAQEIARSHKAEIMIEDTEGSIGACIKVVFEKTSSI